MAGLLRDTRRRDGGGSGSGRHLPGLCPGRCSASCSKPTATVQRDSRLGQGRRPGISGKST